jgi:putative spermidine/putrescine transport system ATP-binding protein
VNGTDKQIYEAGDTIALYFPKEKIVLLEDK